VPNAKDVVGADHLSFLLVGSPGSGKTTLFRTLPGRGFLYIFDPNALASLEGMDVEYEIFSPDLLDINVQPLSSDKNKAHFKAMKAKEPIAYTDFERTLDQHLDTGFLREFDWIGMDSFTTFSDMVMDRVTWMNERFGKQPEQADWSAQMMTIQNVARSITAQNKMLVCTAHEEVRQDEKTKQILVQPWLTGKLKVRLPLLFSNIYRCVSDGGAYFVQTSNHSMYKYMRSSLKGLSNEDIDVTIPYDPASKEFIDPQEHGLGKLLREAGYMGGRSAMKTVTPITAKKGKR
jgi:AAA domain